MSSICSICEGKLEDGRALPCGKWACNLCIDFLSTTDKKQMACKNCDKKHVVPPDGFPSESKSAAQTPELNIKENCDQARAKVEHVIAEACRKLVTYRGEFLHQIDTHEQKCLDNLNLLSKKRAEIRQIMERPKNSNSDIDNASQMLEKIDKAVADSKNIVSFNENKEYTFSKDLLGQVKLKSRNVLYLENLVISREISIKTQLKDALSTHSGYYNDAHSGYCYGYNNNATYDLYVEDYKNFKVNFLSDGQHFVVAYLNKKLNINITLFDKSGNAVKQVKNILSDTNYFKIDYFNIFISSKGIFLVVRRYRSLDYKNATQLRSFDFKLNERKLIELGLESTLMNSFYGCLDDKLYVLINDYLKCSALTIYNSELDVIERKRHDSQQSYPFFSKSHSCLIISDYLIFSQPMFNGHEFESITLINRISGTFVKSIKMPQFNYFYSFSGKLFTLDMRTASFRVYDEDFELLDEIKLDNKLLDTNDRIVPCLENKQIAFFYLDKLKLVFLESRGYSDEIITFL